MKIDSSGSVDGGTNNYDARRDLPTTLRLIGLKPDTPVSLVARALAAYFDQPYGIASDDAVRDSGIERYLSTARDLQEWYAQLARCEPAMLNALRS